MCIIVFHTFSWCPSNIEPYWAILSLFSDTHFASGCGWWEALPWRWAQCPRPTGRWLWSSAGRRRSRVSSRRGGNERIWNGKRIGFTVRYGISMVELKLEWIFMVLKCVEWFLRMTMPFIDISPPAKRAKGTSSMEVCEWGFSSKPWLIAGG